MDGRFNLKDVTRCFEKSPGKRLDHKEIVRISKTFFFCYEYHVLYLDRQYLTIFFNNVTMKTGVLPNLEGMVFVVQQLFRTLLASCTEHKGRQI
jgi:hypothetical protein